MDVKEKIIEAVKLLDEIEDYDKGLADKQSKYDLMTEDLLHLIEGNTLKTNQCYRVIREIKTIRNKRRKVKNDMALMGTYKANQHKLLEYNNRKMLLSEIGKKEKMLGAKYHNKVYTEEDIKNIIGG